MRNILLIYVNQTTLKHNSYFLITVSGIELTNFNDSRKNKDTKVHHGCKHFGASWIVFPMFFAICQIKKNYQRKNSTLKHAVVNSNKFWSQNGIKNRQDIQSRFQHYKLVKYKSLITKNKVVSSPWPDNIAWQTKYCT